MLNDVVVMLPKIFEEIGLTQIPDPERVSVILDHYFPAPTTEIASHLKTGVEKFLTYGNVNYLGPIGVSHQVMCERGLVEPGMLILGSDSHSSMYGAFGAAGAGIGTTEMVYVLATGNLWFMVPESVRFNLRGQLASGVTAKDLILSLIGNYGGDYGAYKAIEYGGSGLETLSMSERMTISNMGAEFGAKFAMFEADQHTLSFMESTGVPNTQTFASDEGATYLASHDIDLSTIDPQIARPSAPDNVTSIGSVTGVKVDQAYLGSCTNARSDDLAIAARLLKDRKVHPNTRLMIAPASQKVLLDATKAGDIATLIEAGAHILPTGCGACAGLHSGILGDGDVCISSTNRNFAGRMGSPKADVYLASPASVVSAAIAGEIVDPRSLSGSSDQVCL